MFSPAIAQRGIGSPYDTFIQSASGGDWSRYLLIKAIISTESAWNPTAVRLEPRIRDASYGLMQILLGTAQWLGYAGDANGLYAPETNIIYGTRYLAYQLSRYPGSLSDAISAYNGGHARRATGGGYVNQRYVDEVNTYYVWYQNNQPAAEAPVPPDEPPPAPAPVPALVLDVDPETGTITDKSSGNPIVSAVDTITGVPIELTDVTIDTTTGNAYATTSGNPVELEMLDASTGTLVPFIPPSPSAGSWVKPATFGAAALVGGVVVLALATLGRQR